MIKPMLLLMFILICTSCSKVSPRQSEQENIDIKENILQGSRYIKNQSFDVFQLEPWYIYDEENHIIWPNFNVYVLRIDGEYYKFQLIDYYNKQNMPGHYTMRIEKEGDLFSLWKFNAAACGNVYTNPDFEKCFNNPDQNIFTYLNLKTRKSFRLNAGQSQESKDWHIAFNGTNIKINSGVYGPGDVRVGLLYKFQPFYQGNNVDWQKISEYAFGDKGIEFFDLKYNYRKATFFLPQGVKRVVNESDWFSRIDGDVILRKENDKNWWVLKNPEDDSYTKFRISKVIEERLDNDTIETNIQIEFYHQASGSPTFDSEKQSWQLPTFNSATERIKLCLDFDTKSFVECSQKSRWDLRLSVFNWDPLYAEDREWKFLVNQGAFGPISEKDMLLIKDGRE